MNIILIGMPLSGKTTIGRRISEKLSIQHIDLDEEIERAFGESIYELFLRFGESHFREIENEYFKKIDLVGPSIVSIGGGAANSLNSEIISLYQNRIWLQCSAKRAISRYQGLTAKRPLLHNTTNLIDKWCELYEKRKIFFKNLSNIIIDTSDLDINGSAEKVIMEMI